MTPVQTTWTVLIAAQAVVNAPFLLNLLKGLSLMPISDKIQAALTQMDTSIAAIPAVVQAAVNSAETQAAQDMADTEAAVQGKADELKQAVGS